MAALAIAICVFICLFGHLGAIGLVGPDEPRYTWIARAMAQTGDWVTPKLYGQPWFEKPVLYYWAAAIGFLLHLPAEWSARLPSAFAALAAALTIGWLGWKHYGETEGLARSPALLAPLIFSTSVGAIGFARAAAPDMLFSALLALAMASVACIFYRADALRGATDPELVIDSPRGDSLPLILFGAFLGLAVLAKGPAAVVLAGGAVALWAAATRRWRVAFKLLHPLAIGAFCIIALPWYILCARRNPDFLRVFLLQHNFERYLTPLFQHRQPFWYFGPIVLLALLPWTALLWPVAQEGLRLWRDKSWKNSPGFFFACWAIFPVLFFSLSQSKLPGYVLPSIPPLALLCAVGASRALGRAFTKNQVVRLGVALGVTWIVILIAAGIAGRRIPWRALAGGNHALLFSLCVLAAIAILAAAGMAFTTMRGKFALTIALCLAATAASVEVANLGILPVTDGYYWAKDPIPCSCETMRIPTAFSHINCRAPGPTDWHFTLPANCRNGRLRTPTRDLR